MSSLRNAVKRVTHKERSQPQARTHLGILEKKRDYQIRSKDFHNKQDRVQQLRRLATMRNPDEFYFGMKHAQVDAMDGKHKKTQQARQKELEEQLGGSDAIRIMKDQDLSYIRMQQQLDTAKIQKLQSNLHFLEHDVDEAGDHDDEDEIDQHIKGQKRQKKQKRKHTIFVDTLEEAKSFDVVEHFDTVPELAHRAFNRPRVETLRQSAAARAMAVVVGKSNHNDIILEEDENQTLIASQLTKQDLEQQRKMNLKVSRKIDKARSSAYHEMEARRNRVATLKLAETHLVTEKLVASKGRKRKIQQGEDGKPSQYKWRRKRQR